MCQSRFLALKYLIHKSYECWCSDEKSRAEQRTPQKITSEGDYIAATKETKSKQGRIGKHKTCLPIVYFTLYSVDDKWEQSSCDY